MDDGGWIEIHNAQIDYLGSRVVPTTVRTLLLSRNHPEFKKMIKWCKCKRPKNIKGTWAPEHPKCAPINFKFWHDKEAKKFMNQFKKYIDSPPTTIF